MGIVSKYQIIGAACLVVLAWFIGAMCLVALSPDETKLVEGLESMGALFSGLAFLAAVGAVWLQRVDLDLQRKVLVETQAEVKAQREQMEIQNATILRQRFENTFFNLVALYGDVVEKTTATGDKGPVSGKDAINIFYNILGWKFAKGSNDSVGTRSRRDVFSGFHRDYDRFLGHYFRLCYRVLKYIDDSNLADAEKKVFTGLFRALMSQNELELILFNCAYGHGAEKFKPLAEKYAFLEQVDKDKHSIEELMLFEPGAFGLASWDEYTPTQPA